tara:strand:+ start:855 stop:1076 length:222 start_codon:yes stop_codon:yes gene_type:complete
MLIKLKKIIFIITFNLSLFLILMNGIQNSSTKKRVNLIFSETVRLPLSFIVGVSFITGSMVGSILNLNLDNKN